MSDSRYRQRRLPSILAAALLALVACSPVLKDVGDGYATGGRSQPEVLEQLRPEPVWLLGELHDSPHAHQSRWRDLSQRVATGWRPTLVMEQFDRERQPDLDAAMAECADSDCIVQRAGGGGWDWSLLAPVLKLALEHRLPIVAANVSQADASRVVREGLQAALTIETMHRFGLPESLTPEVRAALEQAIDRGHCGQLPPDLIPRMALAQVARDVWMAYQLTLHDRYGVVLLAGNGHVRRDAGVPHWLRQIGQMNVLAVGYEEEGAEVAAGHYDQLRRIQPHPRPDPCASLRMGPGPKR